MWLPSAIICLTRNTLEGYGLSAVFFGLSSYPAYYFYRLLWLHNWGRPLSEEKKRKVEQFRRQGRDYQRNNLYNTLYRFADSTEIEYESEKAKEELRKNRQ